MEYFSELLGAVRGVLSGIGSGGRVGTGVSSEGEVGPLAGGALGGSPGRLRRRVLRPPEGGRGGDAELACQVQNVT